MIPVEHAHRIAAALGPRAHLHLEPEGTHSCNNLYTRIRPAVADWVAERLRSADEHMTPSRAGALLPRDRPI